MHLSKIVKYIVPIILLILLMFFVGTYEGFNLLYYQENEANECSYYISIPFILFTPLIAFRQKLKYSLKDNRILDATKSAIGSTFAIIVFWYFIITPIISGAIITTNHLWANSKQILIRGRVTDIKIIEAPKMSEAELTILINNKRIVFDTNGIEIRKYKIGDTFQKEMILGFWRLLEIKR